MRGSIFTICHGTQNSALRHCLIIYDIWLFEQKCHISKTVISPTFLYASVRRDPSHADHIVQLKSPCAAGSYQA